jgi:hypothetical protein
LCRQFLFLPGGGFNSTVARTKSSDGKICSENFCDNRENFYDAFLNDPAAALRGGALLQS